MKKLLIAILVVSMIASLAVVYAFADDAVVPEGDGITASDPGQHDPITIEALDVEAEEGATEVEVPVVVSDIDPEIGISAIIASFEVEGAEIKADGVKAGELPGDNLLIAQFEDYDVVYWADAAGIKNDNVQFVTLTVAIPEDAKEGDVYTVKVLVDQDPDMYLSVENGEDGNRISYGAIGEAGLITITPPVVDSSDTAEPISTEEPGTEEPISTEEPGTEEPAGIPGDVNGDGALNAKDVVAIMKHLVGKTPEKFDEKLADYNGDGSVNAKDVVKLMKDIIAAASK